ncbi:SRPBCC domain-containing protein [Algoriphagus sp.]|uniref:SRPBCC family protein n=1 Tax=Algoriphagus sp. TaxID=1872435 RepID=UPI0025F931A2|nr:SRPBCC domain-containing protein [Algoriphagus sp.]
MFKQLHITRYFPQPIEIVYNAFTTSESLQKWWGPEGFELETRKFEFHPEGVFHFVLKSDAFDMWAKWVFNNIREPHKLSVINSFSNELGETIKAPVIPFGEDWPIEMVLDLEFYEEDGKTRIDMVSFPHNASDASKKLFSDSISQMEEGFKGTFDQLEAYLMKIG